MAVLPRGGSLPQPATETTGTVESPQPHLAYEQAASDAAAEVTAGIKAGTIAQTPGPGRIDRPGLNPYANNPGMMDYQGFPLNTSPPNPDGTPGPMWTDPYTGAPGYGVSPYPARPVYVPPATSVVPMPQREGWVPTPSVPGEPPYGAPSNPPPALPSSTPPALPPSTKGKGKGKGYPAWHAHGNAHGNAQDLADTAGSRARRPGHLPQPWGKK